VLQEYIHIVKSLGFPGFHGPFNTRSRCALTPDFSAFGSYDVPGRFVVFLNASFGRVFSGYAAFLLTRYRYNRASSPLAISVPDIDARMLSLPAQFHFRGMDRATPYGFEHWVESMEAALEEHKKDFK